MSIFTVFFYLGQSFSRYECVSMQSLGICDRFSKDNECSYFACIDSIYQCGPANILVQFSYPLCDATLEKTYHSFTRSGQKWAQTVQTCLIQELNYLLRKNSSVSCTEIDRYILNKYPICLTQSHATLSICSIACNDLEVLLHIFDHWTLRSIHLKRLLLEASRLCDEKSRMEDRIDIKRASLRTILWSLCLDSVRTKFLDFDPNEIMIRIGDNTGLFAERTDEEDENS